MATAAETTAKEAVKTAEKAKAATEQFTTAGAKAFKESVEKSLSTLNELNAHSKHNIEALVASATATAKGAESLGAHVLAYSKSAVEHQVETAKALSAARSVQEVIELQTAFAKSSLETYITEMNRASEIFSATIKGAFRPLNERATAVVETLQAAR